MPIRTPLLSLTVAAVAAGSLATTAAAAPTVRVHAIFGGQGVHVGQVLAVQARGAKHAKPRQVCWDPAPIGRPACSSSENGAPSATGTTKLTVTLSDGTELRTSIRVAPAFRHRGGLGGSNAAPGHVTCASLPLLGNLPKRGVRRDPRDRVTTLRSGAQVAQFNRIGKYVFYWEYATNRAGFGRVGCVGDGLGA